MKKEPKIDDLQFISYGGEKQFTVIPYDEFVTMRKTLEDGEAKMGLTLEKSKELFGALIILQKALDEMSAVMGDL